MTAWPLLVEPTRREARLYLELGADPAGWDLPTRCVPWTVRDVTRHLAATFERFADMLEQSRAGDLSPPFERAALDAENLRAVDAFEGNPEQAMAFEVDRFLELVVAGDEVMAHQRGPIPVALQVLFGLADLAFHHDDIAAAMHSSYRPAAEIAEALAPVWRHLGVPLDDGDPWEAMTRWRNQTPAGS